ncbi:MAG: hypothetical protein K2P93_00285 [Alphaproteobacteria bacterium]|nr:hypothetical protein [Alphaproteobacteria bacterium]
MLKVIEPTNHNLHNNSISSLLRLYKVYQGFELSPKDQDKATFIVAEDDTRGVYGGAVFFPQKIKELDEPLYNFLSIQENRTVWCARLCLCIEQEDGSLSLELLELYENFYRELYKTLGILGNEKDTNCLPIKLRSKDYRNSLLYGNWAYFTELKPEELSSDYVYVLLALPGQLSQAQIPQEEEKGESKCLDTPNSVHTDRPVQ